MIINYRGPWKETTLDGQAAQIHIIGQKMTFYKVTLGIPQSAIDRVVAADTMIAFSGRWNRMWMVLKQD